MLNLINGEKELVNVYYDKRIKAVSFVGSTPVAKSIYENSALNGKGVTLGGAKNHALILSDANIEYTTDQIISAVLVHLASDVWLYQ